MNEQLQRHSIQGIANSQYSDNQILNQVIQSLKAEDFRNLINGLDGKESRALVALLTIHPKLIYVISGASRLRESEQFELFAMSDWYFVYKSKQLLFSNGSREIIERIFRHCIYYEALDLQEQEKPSPTLNAKQPL